ncbi:MAG: hypothetical protein HZA77_10480 [Candidatus Schekmanbacteria bacterium]|nr:hypothetical protein [Candidatus Schekmanbacteria bacterium]
MLADFIIKLQKALDSDQELIRRLKGFKTFAGTPDGHYRRARLEGEKAIARAVRCYPFGGKSHLDGKEIIGINIADGDSSLTVSLKNGKFKVASGKINEPCLSLEIPKEIFKLTILGRYRWLWTIGMDEVNVKYIEGLPHSDWVTIFELLVIMQELNEFDTELRDKIEKL